MPLRPPIHEWMTTADDLTQTFYLNLCLTVFEDQNQLQRLFDGLECDIEEQQKRLVLR
jgi:hypothetical protein